MRKRENSKRPLQEILWRSTFLLLVSKKTFGVLFYTTLVVTLILYTDNGNILSQTGPKISNF